MANALLGYDAQHGDPRAFLQRLFEQQAVPPVMPPLVAAPAPFALPAVAYCMGLYRAMCPLVCVLTLPRERVQNELHDAAAARASKVLREGDMADCRDSTQQSAHAHRVV